MGESIHTEEEVSEYLKAPPRLYERLAQIPGYTWDQSYRPFHSTYDNWHVFGLQHVAPESPGASLLQEKASVKTSSPRSSPRLGPRTFRRINTGTDTTAESVSSKNEGEKTYVPVVARISTHTLRIEREYHLCKTFIQTSDPNCEHVPRLIDLVRLPSRGPADGATLICAIFESPGRNYMKELMDFGPAWLGPVSWQNPPVWDGHLDVSQHGRGHISVSRFLEFAIGATECLELLHHGLRVVHGELRADAFHYNRETGVVKLVNFGSGPRSFEHGLTSTGWITLSREVGVKHKLQYIAPEQTGRMPAEPDARTDIYSLGLIFWTMLTGKPAFEGDTPIDVVQALLGRKLPLVSSVRFDVPDVISRIIQKSTQKQISDRYNSTSGLKHDLVEIQKIMAEGDETAIENFQLGSKDVSAFFVLPNKIYGRDEDHEKIVRVIEKVAAHQCSRGERQGSGGHSFGSTSASTISEQLENLEVTTTRSSDTSSIAGGDNGSPQAYPAKITRQGSQSSLRDSLSGSGPMKPPLEGHNSADSVNTNFSVVTRSTHRPAKSLGQQNTSGLLPQRQMSRKSKRRYRVELIAIIGAAGLGKSSLIQNIQSTIRQAGYFAAAKFDPARKAPFEPMLRAMGALFRQIFSESDLDTDYHRSIRSGVRPFWTAVCNMLDLPESLLSNDTQRLRKAHSQNSLNRNSQSDGMEFSSAQSSQTSNVGVSNHAVSDFLRAGGNTRGGANSRSMKFITIFLEVLRILSSRTLICLCLDDLHNADEESLELVLNITEKKLGIIIIATFRDETHLSPTVEKVLSNKGANLTKIQLSPLGENDVIQYVAETLSQTPESILPLAIVCLEKSNGNPFYLRQMLELCYRRSCIWYSWKESRWDYDIDRVFAEFASESYSHQLNTDFITKRLQDLPTTSRKILAWAALLGSSFSFSLVQKLISGEFDYDDPKDQRSNPGCENQAGLFTPQNTEHIVQGLQALINAHILIPGSDEDLYTFSHDRYIQATTSLHECVDIQKMHFIISQTMMHTDLDRRSLYAQAQHVSQAAEVIERRVRVRLRYRKLLNEAAERAIGAGARSTALQSYEACITLLQSDPWMDGSEDRSYTETLNLYTKSAELYWHQGQFVEAQNSIDAIFANARSAADKSSAWILQSRLFTVSGNMSGAFTALKTSLLQLGLEFAIKPTWELCDEEFANIHQLMQKASEGDILERPLSSDSNVRSIGAVLIEATSAAFWSDALLFYQMCIHAIKIHLTSPGTFPQIGLCFAYSAMICTARSNDIPFASQMYDACMHLLQRHGDSFTIGRGLGIASMFIAHLQSSVREHAGMFDEAIEHSLVSGDKHLFLLMTGGMAMNRLLVGNDLSELENFISVAPEDFGNWEMDLRGGICLVAVRQVLKSLQGKTWIESPETIISDEFHSTVDFMDSMMNRTTNTQRPQLIYYSLMLIPLYLYGHYDKVIQIANDLIPTIGSLWSIRNSRLIYFFTSLSIIGKLRGNSANINEQESWIARVRKYKAHIEDWQTLCDANYRAWSLMIEAELCEVQQHYHSSIQAYEAAIDHAQLYDFDLDLAIAFELQGSFFIRRGARRAARATILDAVSIYSRMGALGKADQLKAHHEWVLSGSSTLRTKDAGVQTSSTVGDIENTQFHMAENERNETRNGKETAGDRTAAWINPIKHAEAATEDDATGLQSLGLDVLDLQSILEFNQAISSELQLDRLLSKLTEIILESAGAQADFAGVVIQGEDGWCIAASGTSEGISTEARAVGEIDNQTQKQVLLYTIRFKEVVFVHDLSQDDRFINASAPISVLSIPILQGKDLLGALYLQGQPRSFTTRNLGVLQLFCNQVGISIANALLFKKIAKVSASNASMVESQKLALAKAREAEIKAKKAEAEAMENVRLKEEAARVKSIFLANVSHELRTPLNGVIGMSDLLKSTPLNKEQDGYADSIRVCADTLLTVINDILDFSKLEAGKLKLFSVPLNLKNTIVEVVRALSYTNLDRGVQTIEVLRLDPKLLVMGDPVRLHQIFMNLLSNAYKFTAKGSVTVTATTDKEDSQSLQVTFSVRDTGIGITQEQVSRLFKPFSQADSSTQRSYGGSGLGLSICKALIDVLNGKISLESQLGVGTTVSFTLTFPKAAQNGDTVKAEATKEPDPMATWSSDANNQATSPSTAFSSDLSQIPRDKVRICIAEDNPINQKIAISFVTKLGLKSEAYNDGLQAVEALRRQAQEKQPFHLVLMDCQMPVMDGYEATRLIRKDSDPAVRSVVVVAMTASAIRGDREKCLEAGMNNYLAKPVRAAVLRTMLEEYLNKSPKPIENFQQTTNEAAKKIVEDASSADVTVTAMPPPPPKKQEENQNQNQKDGGKAVVGKKAVRPSLQKRMSSWMSSRSESRGSEKERDKMESEEATPKATVVPDGVVADAAVPALSLNDGAARPDISG